MSKFSFLALFEKGFGAEPPTARPQPTPVHHARKGNVVWEATAEVRRTPVEWHEFRVGDRVVYPKKGMAVVEDIQFRRVGGQVREVYCLRILANDKLVLVPTKSAKSVELLERELADSEL